MAGSRDGGKFYASPTRKRVNPPARDRPLPPLVATSHRSRLSAFPFFSASHFSVDFCFFRRAKKWQKNENHSQADRFEVSVLRISRVSGISRRHRELLIDSVDYVCKILPGQVVESRVWGRLPAVVG